MTKLQQYNQKLLAVVGTLAAIGLILLIGIGIYFTFLEDLFRPKRQLHRDGVVVDPGNMVDTNMYNFKQNISILEPFQLDSAKAIFLIPIGQKNQTRSLKNIAMSGLSFSSTSSDYAYANFTGVFNNFVLVDYAKNYRAHLFKIKVAISEYSYLKIDSTEVILFKGTDVDQNQDGQLNTNDFQKLFVYHLKERKLKELNFPEQTVLNFKPLLKTSKIYVRTGKDPNTDGRYERNKEPSDLYFYDVTSGESETLVPDKIKRTIQEILDKK